MSQYSGFEVLLRIGTAPFGAPSRFDSCGCLCSDFPRPFACSTDPPQVANLITPRCSLALAETLRPNPLQHPMSSQPPCVCAFESRRGDEMQRLIEKFGGVPLIAPAMREVPLGDHSDVFGFAEDLLSGGVDIVVFMTGVGTTALFEILETRQLLPVVKEALFKCLVIVRGPKPSAVLQKAGIRIDLRAPEPNTWQDVAAELERQQVALSGKRIAVQEYGEPADAFYDWLRSRGGIVRAVPIYRWALPEETAPLEEAIDATIRGEVGVLLFTSAQQIVHVLKVAERLGRRAEWLSAAERCFVGSIGPTASERLRSLGVRVDLEPSHPKMAHLIRETLATVANGQH